MADRPIAEGEVDLQAFRWRLAEAIAWCTERADDDQPASSLRSRELQPPTYHYYPQPPHERLRLADARATAEAHTMVEQLAQRRAGILHATGQYPTILASNLAGGALLLYFPDLNLCDGAAELASAGFFDTDNIPACDTWICFLPDERRWDFLISWIPPQLLSSAQEGVEINPEVCIAWASEFDSRFTQQMQRAGLMLQR